MSFNDVQSHSIGEGQPNSIGFPSGQPDPTVWLLLESE